MAGTRASVTRRLVVVAIAVLAFAAAASAVSHATSRDRSAGERAPALSALGSSSSDAPAIAYRTTTISALRVVHRIRFGETPIAGLFAAAALLLVGAYLRRRRPSAATSPVLARLPVCRRGPPPLLISG
jgi:hypothetical protein